MSLKHIADGLKKVAIDNKRKFLGKKQVAEGDKRKCR
jgi:hypothetical protein